MIPDIRKKYNESFTDERYQAFLDHISRAYHHRPFFRISETPVFVPRELGQHLFRACEEITDVICDPSFKDLTQGALRPKYTTPNEDDHTLFLQMDFGICITEEGLRPKLIEVQGFPSLYFYQDLVARAYREYFDIPDHLNHLFSGLDSDGYLDLLRQVIVGDEDPKQVVLLEVEPRTQTTQIDFLGAEHLLGLKIACISEIRKEGRRIYYIDKHGRDVTIKRIFNRVIYDELLTRKDLPREFRFTQEADVEWVGHPNWFFRISKYTLPFINSQYAPRTWFLDQMEELPEDLDQFVLKPLYSFAGSGVKIHVEKDDLALVTDPSQYILQEKVHYHPVVETPDVPAKCEVRMLMLWEPGRDRPRIVNNLARLSKGEMIGVKYNKDKTWVGGSVAFFEGIS
ncbi:MAG: hypothetical protein R3301_03450 [Saprospiraceae bacterium]|nr:hypothetical protein [Saprospiraceae bacterium]